MILDPLLLFGLSPEERREKRHERWGRELDDQEYEQPDGVLITTAAAAVLFLTALLFVVEIFV